MGKSERSAKASRLAQEMKDRGIKRTSAQCPINHRHTYPVGAGALNHFRLPH